MRHLIGYAAFAFAFVGLSGGASAAPPCTTEPKAKWLSEAAMKAKVDEMGYKNIRTFKTSGNCYEIYGFTKDGQRTEVYFNPVTGAIVEEKRG